MRPKYNCNSLLLTVYSIQREREQRHPYKDGAVMNLLADFQSNEAALKASSKLA